jgi:hypothetical protein
MAKHTANHKMFASYFSVSFVQNINVNKYLGSPPVMHTEKQVDVKCLLLSNINQNWNVLTNFSTLHNIKLNENLLSAFQAVTNSWMDRHVMKLRGEFLHLSLFTCQK